MSACPPLLTFVLSCAILLLVDGGPGGATGTTEQCKTVSGW